MLSHLGRFGLFAGALVALHSSAAAHTTVLDPNGGEFLAAGSTYTLSWEVTIPHNLLNWDLWYSTTGATGTWIPIAVDLPPGDPSEGSIHTFDWKVPGTLSQQVRIRVRMDNDDIDYEDISDADLEIGCAAAQVYCTAKMNSCGTSPSISASGTPSASANSGFVVRATATKAQRPGLLVYSDSGRASVPFEGGLLCVHPSPLKRSTVLLETQGSGNACDGELSIDMNAFAQGVLGGNPLPSLRELGTQVNAQVWARDTPGNSLLSDALEYFVCL